MGDINVENRIEQLQKREVESSDEEIAVDSQTAKDSSKLSLSPVSKLVKKRRKSKSFFRQGMIWGATFAFTASISATIGATFALVSPLSPFIAPLTAKNGSFVENSAEKSFGWGSMFQYNLSRPVNVLVMGIDRVPDVPKGSPEAFAGRSDTMLLLRFEPETHSVKMLSIPRDSRVDIPEVGRRKINDANVEGGPALAARVVSDTLNDVPIDRYLRITTDALTDLVDLVGGVEVFVPEPMHYEDVTQGLYIDLEPGWQTLNGEEAEQFSRFRNYDGGDVGRVQRQQILLKALRTRLENPVVLAKLPQIVRRMQQYVDTNLSTEEMLALVNFGKDLQEEDLQMVLLPGRFSSADEFNASYWVIDSQGRDRVVNEFFNLPAEDSEVSPQQQRRRLRQMQIAVQNATDDPMLTQEVIRYLASENFYNVYAIQDSPMLLRQTEVIAQGGNLESAAMVQEILGLGTIEASSTGDLGSDLTLRLGEDALQLLAD